jgi:phenylacetate-coenzyme A ligase PaaK-like adenylate-forming protein
MFKNCSAKSQGCDLKAYHGRCLETLHTALDLTPLYEAWRPFDPGEDAPIDVRYAALPALTKADIRAHFPYGLVPHGRDLDGALARNEISYVRTSGTADEALINIWNQDWWNGSERASWSLNAHAAHALTGSHREAILASAFSVGPRSDGPPIACEERMLGRFLFLNEYGSVEQWPEGHEKRICAELDEYSPTALEANPSLLARLARWIAREGISAFQPQLITLTYEFPSAIQLRAIRKAFTAPIASSYGSTEAGYVFMECEEGHLHQNSAFCRADIVPLRGFEGQGIGRILATTFGNSWFPLLRFDIGDAARLAPAPCPCGHAFGATLSSIEGRLISIFLASGNRLVTHRRLDQALSEVEGIDDYRLDQESPERVQLRLIAEGNRAERSLINDAREAMHGLLGSELNVKAAVVRSLQPEASGKFLLAKRHFPLNIDDYNSKPGHSNGRQMQTNLSPGRRTAR